MSTIKLGAFKVKTVEGRNIGAAIEKALNDNDLHGFQFVQAVAGESGGSTGGVSPCVYLIFKG